MRIPLDYGAFRSQRGNAALDSNGDYVNVMSREMLREKYLDVEKETLAAYGAELWTDIFPQPEELGRSRHGQVWQYTLPTDVNERVTAADEYVKTALAQLVLGKPVDFDRGWDAMQTTLRNMGLEQAGETLSDMIQMKLKLWQ